MGLVEEEVAGEPESGPRWIRRSLSSLQGGLADRGYDLCRESIRRLLYKHDIRPKSNVKRLTAGDHPDRDRQFWYLQAQVGAFRTTGWPIISVDTKRVCLNLQERNWL